MSIASDILVGPMGLLSYLIKVNENGFVYTSNISIPLFGVQERYLSNSLAANSDLILSASVMPTKSDSDIIFCLQLLSKTLTCTLHLHYLE